MQVQRRARLAASGASGEASAPGSAGGVKQPAAGPARVPLPLWRQRPDYRPGALLTLQDVDLAALDGNSSDEAPATGAGGAVAPAGLPALPGGEADQAAPDAAGDSGSAGVGVRRRRRNFGRKAGPMSEERKAAISRALQSKGAKSEEHKRWARGGGEGGRTGHLACDLSGRARAVPRLSLHPIVAHWSP